MLELNTFDLSQCIDLYSGNLTNEERCHWVQTTEDCITESYVDYLSIFFCSFDDPLFGFKFFLLVCWHRPLT